MTIEQFKNVLHASPFRPFTIHTADGRVFMVKHRDFVSRSPSGRTVIVHSEDDSFSVLDLLLVSELEVHPPESADAA
ncbi:MAG: hypothetical protein AAF710_05550 [Planctomycetota bacterium]